ncbi:hypothetical protein [Aneurinibacillus tyrosinisolvens]|uniref:hypothetical protein n=1 Tax=Aneurinibacillus tyrosinisolvens TaxID=1443435 RepID=UPI0009E5598B|nr:hypothetical protein [Aneurinibacillus tyrosinisolvens]
MKRKKISSGFIAKVMVVCLTVAVSSLFIPLQGGLSNKVYAAEQPEKATWLWNTYSIWKEKDKTLDFLSHNSVTLLYLQIDADIPGDVYRTFISEASDRGIEVHALGGAPDWVLPEHQDRLYQFVHWVNAYNNSVRPVERFNGIHLDVEAHVLSQFKSDQDKVLGLWMDTVSGFVDEVKSENPHLTTGADLPVWLHRFDVRDGHGGRTTLSNWMFGKLDQVTLMAYIDNAQGIIQACSTPLDEAAKNGKPVIVAVETMNNDEENSSFYAKGKASMMRELDTVNRTLSSSLSFSGEAIHNYESWSALKE